MTRIPPTVGRIVLVFRTLEATEPLAGIIVKVTPRGETDMIDADFVNVVYWTEHGSQLVAFDAPIVYEGEPISEPFVRWMPYQLGQAARSEQLQREVDKAKEGQGCDTGPAASSP